MAITQRRVIRPPSCLVLGWGFLGRRIERLQFPVGSNPLKMAAGGHFEELQMAITQQCVIRYTLYLVLGWVFLARIALFNLTAHELHELFFMIGLLRREALDRLCVRLNNYVSCSFYKFF